MISVRMAHLRAARVSRSVGLRRLLTSSPRLKAGDSNLRRLGFLLHGRLRKGGPLPTDTSSTGIARVSPGYGTTCRKDVLRRVEVPVVQGAAGRTRPVPGGERQFRQQVSARRAGFG